MTDDWPSHTDELTRKTSEQLDRWTKLYEGGKISKRDYFLIVNVLYDTTIGLVSMELSDLIAEIHQSLRTKELK